MRQVRVRELGTSIARCAHCRELATLSLRETRYARRWNELLSPGFDPSPLRTASCARCGTTYPVRSTDHDPTPASRRTPAATSGGWQYPAQQSA